MILSSWRKRRANKKKKTVADDLEALSTHELSVPTHFRCPISLDLMRDPVTLSTGITYDRDSIETWFMSGNQTCPVTNQVLFSFDQIPNHSIRKMIQDWCVQNRSRGVDRIPTPRVPVSAHEITDTCQQIEAASRCGDHGRCVDLVARVRAWGRDSDRNRRVVSDNGAGCVLATLLENLAVGFDFDFDFSEERVGLVSDVLSVLTWTFPKGREGRLRLGSEASLRCMTWQLRNGDLSARKNTLHVLRELLGSDEDGAHVRALSETDSIAEALVNVVKNPICPSATSSSLMIIFYMVSNNNVSTTAITSRFIELGLVSMIVEVLVDGDKGTCERALGVLDRLCEAEEGRAEAYGHAMTVGVVVKKMLRVSEAATEFAMSVLWRLRGREEAVVEAVQVGAFQKVLVLFQVGCGEGVREKATKLLKLLNQYKDKAECVECSMDFKYLKRSC